MKKTSKDSYDNSPKKNGSVEDVILETSDQSFRYNLSKYEYDLYHEEDDVPNPIIRVKRFELPNSGEKWKVFADNKEKFVIDGYKLNKKEKEFLRSIDGVNFVINLFKSGIKSFNFFKIQLKNKLKNSA